MPYENPDFQKPVELQLSDEAFADAVNTIHDLSKTALHGVPKQESYSSQTESRAIAQSLETVLNGEHGPEAQQALWEASSAWARSRCANDTAQGVMEQANFTLDNVRTIVTGDLYGGGSTTRNHKIDYLRNNIYGPYGLNSARDELDHLSRNYTQASHGMSDESRQNLWASDVRTLGYRVHEKVRGYHRESHEQVEASYSALRYGADSSVAGLAQLEQFADSQQRVGQDLAEGREPDQAAMANGARLYDFAEIVKDAVQETDTKGLIERFKAIIGQAPSVELIHNASQNIMEAAVSSKQSAGQNTLEFSDNMGRVVNIVSDDLERQFDMVARSRYGTPLSMGSSMELLVSTPANALQQLNSLAQGWADQVDANLQPLLIKN